MILRALYDYYNRCGEEIAPMGMALVNFKYAIVIDADGDFLQLEALGGDDGLPLLTIRPEERTSAPVAHFWGDNGSYVLGLKNVKPTEGFDYEKELQANGKNHNAFKADIERIFSLLPDNLYARAIHRFYQRYCLDTIRVMSSDCLWEEFCGSLDKNMTFRVRGEIKLAASDEEAINKVILDIDNCNDESLCLVTGEKGKPVKTTYSTFVVGGKSNAKLVAFQENSGYDSYGKEKGLNAPISEEAEFKYTTALLKLLKKGSRNKFLLGGRTFVFWSSNNNEASVKMEESLFSLLGFTEDQNDDPNAKIEEVRKVFKAIYSGVLRTSLDDRFYILGLAPNSARIAVVYWSETSLKDFAGKIERHFSDMEIAGAQKEKKSYMGLRDILSNITLGGKVSDATPNLPEAIAKSIFQGLPYPYTLFSSCIRRIRAEQGTVYIGRAAIIKAYLNRLNDNKNKKIEIMLDKGNENPGYLCGRLFAVLDKIQEDANKIHSIRERYMNAASSTPAAIFATILNLSSHHSEKLSNDGTRIYYEQIKQEIISKLPADGFPTHLGLQDQGRFFVGYYHQRQDFFTAKKEQSND